MTNSNKGIVDAFDEVEFKETRPNYVKFNKVGDFIQGTLMSIVMPDKPDRYGKRNKLITLKADKGMFFGNDENKVIDKDATIIDAGQICRVQSKPVIDDKMVGAQIGQKVKFSLLELRKSDKGADAKIINVQMGVKKGTNEPLLYHEWLQERDSENF